MPDADSAFAPDQPPRPVFLYDGDCGFCRAWVTRWQRKTGEQVEYASYQTAATRFPDLSCEARARAAHLIESDGQVFRGAEAVFRTLRLAGGGGWGYALYGGVPGFAPLSEFVYRQVAGHRRGISRVTSWLWGDLTELASYLLTRWLFLRLLAVVYFIAFLSLHVQILGLVGSQGIVPIAERLSSIQTRLGGAAWWQLPTLCWWDASDRFLILHCVLGEGLAVLLLFNIAPFVSLAGLWALYLSLTNAGSVFLNFQWDILLLETGLLAIFFAPISLWPTLWRESPPSRLALWMVRWLLFRLMFLSGLVKLTQDSPTDPTWHDLTALNFHYETQPLPTWTSWYTHQLPEWFQAASVVVTFGIELGMPFLIFAPRKLRFVAALAIAFFMAVIGGTGNYNFFNLLTVVLCVSLLDDALLKRVLPRSLARRAAVPRHVPRGLWVRRTVLTTVALAYLALSTAIAIPSFGREVAMPEVALPVVRRIWSFHSINSYGLFRHMTARRPEIIIEGSQDGRTWQAYEFKWKPGDPQRRPRFVQPHQPRLDWQMWFAALGNFRQQRDQWFTRLMHRIQEGSPDVLGLLEFNPFPESPPRFLRAVLYDYHFTTAEERRATGAWWSREPLGTYHPILRRKEG